MLYAILIFHTDLIVDYSINALSQMEDVGHINRSTAARNLIPAA
jgi:hypothetical protein